MNTIKVLITLAAFVLAPAAALARSPLQVAGYDTQVRHEVIQSDQRFTCTPNGICVTGQVAYAGTTARIGVKFIDGGCVAVSAIHIDADRFFDLVAALKQKYGKPLKSEHDVVQNAFGAKYENVIVLWRRGGQTLRIERYSGRIDESAITLTNDALLGAYEAENVMVSPDEL